MIYEMIHSRKQTCPIATYVLVTRNGITPRSPYPPGLRPAQQGLYVGGAGGRADRAVWVWSRLFLLYLEVDFRVVPSGSGLGRCDPRRRTGVDGGVCVCVCDAAF